LNRVPQVQERSFYSEHDAESYAVVSFVPGLTADDRALLISGTTSAGTDAGLRFVLNEAAFGSTLKTIEEGSHGIPWFEILLRTRNLDWRAPGRSEVIAWRLRKH
jgi:hypothetical protein